MLGGGAWTVWGVCDAKGVDVVSRLGLRETDPDLASIVALIDRLAMDGGRGLPDNRNHAICDDPKILQLTAGRFRITYAFHGYQVIVLCYAFRKRGGKRNTTPPSELKVAKRIHKAFLGAVDSNSIEYLDEDDDEPARN